MEYGCRIWDAQGEVMLDTTDHTARLIYSTTKAGDSSGSVYISEADGTMPFICTSSENGRCMLVGISTSGTLNWAPVRDWNGTVLSDTTLIFVYICDEKA